MLSIIEEVTQRNLGRMVYYAKHPFLNLAVNLGSLAAGGLGGYSYAKNYGLDPYSGAAFGLVNGANLGEFGGEMLDRGIRNLEGDPYRGKRTTGDAIKDLAIGLGAGNSVTAAMRSNDLPFSGFGGYVGGELAKALYHGMDEPEELTKSKKK